MNLRLRVKKLIQNRETRLTQNHFIVADSKEREEEQVRNIKENFQGSLSLLHITVFKLYD